VHNQLKDNPLKSRHQPYTKTLSGGSEDTSRSGFKSLCSHSIGSDFA
jgi:hypothetical protein